MQLSLTRRSFTHPATVKYTDLILKRLFDTLPLDVQYKEFLKLFIPANMAGNKENLFERCVQTLTYKSATQEKLITEMLPGLKKITLPSPAEHSKRFSN